MLTLTDFFLIIGTLNNEVIFLKWTKSELLQAKDNTIVFDERIDFDEHEIGRFGHLRELHDVEVSGNIHYDDDSNLALANLDISGVMVLPCSITNEDVDYPFEISSEEVFSFRKVNEDEDFHEVKKDTVELYPAIFQLIVMEIPFKVVKEGIKEYPKGNGWEVIKEGDLKALKEQKIDPRLAKLKEFKIEE